MIIDVNAFCGHWPFERLPRAEPGALAKRLRQCGIGKALVSPLEGIFYKSPQDANEAMFEAIRRHPNLLPVAVVDPTGPCWRKHMARNVKVHGARAVKLHPNYHGYTLDQAPARELLESAAALKVPVIVQLQMEDARAQHSLARMPPVDPAQALKALPPDLAVPVILGGLKLSDLIRLSQPISAHPRLYVEISWFDRMDCMAAALETIPADRLLFATHQPLFYPECALAKVREGQLSPRLENAVFFANARRLFGGGSRRRALSRGNNKETRSI